MTIASEIQRIQTNIANAYDALEAKGATMPATENTDNLVTTIDTISGGGGDVVTATNNTGNQILAGDKVWMNEGQNASIMLPAPVSYSIENFDDFEFFNTFGSPTIDNSTHIASGFSTTNYLNTLKDFTPVSQSWEIKTKITTGNNVSSPQAIFSGFNVFDRVVLGVTDSHFWCLLSSDNSNWDIMEYTSTQTVSANTSYWLKLSFTGTSYILEYSTNGTSFTTLNTVTSSTNIYNSKTPLGIGVNRYSNGANIPWLGSIDLSETYINVNDALFWKPYLPSITENTLMGYAQENIASGSTGDVLTLLPPPEPKVKTYIIQMLTSLNENMKYLISSNGIEYEEKTISNAVGGPTSGGRTCYYCNDHYYLKGNNKLMVTTTPYDSSSWARCNISPSVNDDALTNITYGNGIYIAKYLKSIYTSEDGMNFVKGADVFSNSSYTGSIIFDSGIFVAALGDDSSSGSGGGIYTSTDGINWTTRKTFTGRVTIKGNSLIYDGEKFILNCNKGLFYSTNGTTWQTGTKPTGSGNIAYCNGVYLITLGDSTYYSSDLSNWTLTTTTSSYPFISSDGEKFFRTYFTSGNNFLEISTNGQNWETYTLPVGYKIEVNGDIKND